ncbi:MAG: class I tRNA ligase family protein, partial [Candidatus Paceibacterota bacterium]
DIYARMLRLRGKNVLYPIGFDAFGLPAERAAIKHGLDPREWTYKNIERMRGQLASMGASFDWSKEVVTCDPEYYQWTQWLFSKLFEHGLAERREASVKWCPVDMTVLANEQVVDGACERCGTAVEEKRLTQWFLKITDYAERLLDGLEKLPWREEIKEAQRAWIGKSEGAYLEFALAGSEGKIKVFTTRPDTLYGATYVVLAPEHPLVVALLPQVPNEKEVEKYINATAQKTERERSENKVKTGVKLEGVMAINPGTNEEIPVYVADYVLGSYGTGAVMAVPAHDERDAEFAAKYNLPVVEKAFVEWEVIEAAGGVRATQYRLRDWSVSRQRYWGCPIPIVYDPEGKPHAVPAENLPWLLPTDVDFAPTGKASPLASSKELQERVTKLFGEGWTPEYDTLDTFVDSSWYFARYLDSKNEHDFSDTAMLKKWLPVNRYSGGSEHTTMHLLYARFFTKALHDLALVDIDEPFIERFNRGLIMGPDGQKMSKSKGNVINPDDFVQKFGADAVRIYLAFIGPYNEPGSYPWNLDGVTSMRKFLDRVERLAERAVEGVATTEETQALARAAKKVAEDGDRFKFNTGVSALMVALNAFEGADQVSRSAVGTFLVLLAPFAPHLAEHLWEALGREGSVHAQPWPDLAVEEASEVEVTVQVGGKRRGALMLAPDASEADAVAAAHNLAAVATALGGGSPTRVVYVPGKILNLVV